MRLLVCGGAGFIGSTFVHLRLRDHGDEVTVLDKLTYAGRKENLHDVIDEVRFVHGAIEDPAAVAEAIAGADAIVNFAAETHVDRSISGPEAFIVTNMQGTHVLLEAARERGLRYVQVSTDEVYGSIEEGSFTESSPLAPSSPYSATKTGADLLVASYFHTYGLETRDLPRLEQLRALPVSGEADPADDPQRARRRPPPGVRGWAQRPQLAVRRGLRSGDRARAGARRARRGLQLRRSGRVREHRGGQADPVAHRCR